MAGRRKLLKPAFWLLVAAAGALYLIPVDLGEGQPDTNGIEQQNPSGGSSEPETEPRVLLEPVDPNQEISTWSNYRLLLSVVNGSKHFNIVGISIDIPAGMALDGHMSSHEDEMKSEMKGSTFSITEGFELRSPNERRFLGVLELTKKPIGKLKGQFLSILTYTPRKEIVLTRMNYRDGVKGTGAPKIWTTETLELSVHAHPLGIYAGAVLGALFSAVLGAMMVLQPGSTGGPWIEPPAGWINVFISFFVRLGTGVVATAIAIFIFQTTTNFEFPIAIEVKDFYGGFLLGLFGNKVAASIYERIYTQRREPDGDIGPANAEK